MCGIFALFNSPNNHDDIANEFSKGSLRGPEFSKLQFLNNSILGFHRLAINGLNSNSNQPFEINNILLICNGEIYNYKELYKTMNVKPTTQSDCEVIIHLYLKYGIEHTLQMLDGVFAFVLVDNNKSKAYIARDPFGVRPLYKLDRRNLPPNNKCTYGFASELKCLQKFYNENYHFSTITQFKPGTFSVLNLGKLGDYYYIEHIVKEQSYFIPSFSYSFSSKYPIMYKSKQHINLVYADEDETNKLIKDKMLNNIAYYLWSAVEKRCETTDREVACLLSGGLDSSLIAALVTDHFKRKGKIIETYSIGLPDSEDVKNARIVAEYIGSNHHEIIITEEEMFNAIPEVIDAIESYDTTTVRASIGNYLIGKYITKHSRAKVIFNGDGSDELFGGYLYMNNCPDDIEFDKETRRLLKDIHNFDVLRSDKCISSNGLEPRTPFLDRTFVNYVLSIPPYFRNHTNFEGEPEKYLLRRAFNNHFLDFLGRKILPDEILWRRKEAFSDGVSSKGRSLYTILQEKIADHYTMSENDTWYEANIETEKIYYKQQFDKYYPNCSHIIPYFWMPKYTNARDPSARTLTIYNS